MASPSFVTDILDDNATDKYNIEFGGFMSNHLAHGVVAVASLGGSRDRITQFVEWYRRRLEKPQTDEISATSSLDELMGLRQNYYGILSHYLDLTQRQSLDDVIREQFPRLCTGMIGAAFHGLIHTGYGYSATSRRVVSEGLAYLHQANLPLIVSHPDALTQPLGVNGSLDIIEVLDLLRDDKGMYDFAILGSKVIRDPRIKRLGGVFPRRAGSLLTFRGDDLLRYVNKIKLPEFYDPKKDTVSQLEPLLKWLVDCAITVYVMAETRNDFFLLHGVTAAWSLRQILPVLQDVADVNKALRVFLCCLLSAYVAQGSPALHPQFLPSNESGMPSWGEIIKEALSQDRDEHVFKLVQVCHDMYTSGGDPKMRPVYKEATKLVLNNHMDLAFGYLYIYPRMLVKKSQL